jgi:hypothetical protein
MVSWEMTGARASLAYGRAGSSWAMVRFSRWLVSDA